MEPRLEELPKSIQELAATLGLDATLAIVEARGGIRLYVPRGWRSDHWLVPLIGPDALRQLVAHWGGEEIDIPRCEASLRAARERQIGTELQGDSVARVARRYGYTERGIRKLRRRLEERGEIKDTQQELF